ncbi:MAG: hypothetical protein WD009_07615 [Phycisphaeraceae bacterium]
MGLVPLPRYRRALAAAALLAIGPGIAPALADDATPPALVRPQRLVHRFDFEEQDLGNFESMPMHWYAIGQPPRTTAPNFDQHPLHRALTTRRGYPAYSEIRFDDAHARSDAHSFYFSLNGGNAGAFLEVGALPAVPGSDYLVNAEVRTEQLERAGARLRAYFIDNAGKRIDASVAQSTPVRTGGRWTELAVNLRGDFRDAAWIGLELELVQPQPGPHHPLGAHQVVLRDVHGQAWFDNVTIWHVPHLELRTPSPVNIIRAPASPELAVDIRDLTGHPLAANLDVYDHRRELIDNHAWTFAGGISQRGGVTPDLPGYGWYLFDLSVHDVHDADAPFVGRPVARTVAAVLYLPAIADVPADQVRRFALVADNLPEHQLKLMPELLSATGLHRIVLSAFDEQTPLDGIESRLDLLEDVAHRARLDRHELALSLSPLPHALLEAMPGEADAAMHSRHPLVALRQPANLWLEHLTPLLMRLGEQTLDWHLGPARDGEAFYDPELMATLDDVRRQFRTLVSQPRFVLPWRLDQPRPPATPADVSYMLDLPPSFAADALDEALEPWAGPDSPAWLVVRELPADQQPHDRRVASLAHRMVHAWRSDPRGLALGHAWTAGDTRDASLMPDPLLGVYVQIAPHLADRRFIGELPLAPGLRGLVAHRHDGGEEAGENVGGMIVAWNEAADPEDAHLEMDLGGAPVAYDVWGNARELQRVDGRHRVELDDKPLFITGVDAALAMFRAGFAIDQPEIESTQQGHRRTLTVTNPFPQTLTGQLRFIGPAGWDIQPGQHSFAIPGGGRIELPVTLRFPIMEVAGPRELVARADIIADERYRVDVSVPIELGLTGIEFDASIEYQPRGDGSGAHDAVLTCLVTNVDRRAGGFAVFANMPEHPRQERLIPRLEPGQSVVRRFRFEHVDPDAPPAPIRTGVRETAGPAILNRIIE